MAGWSRWSRTVTGLVGPAIARGGGFLRQSWQMAVVAIILVAGAWTIPAYWSDMKNSVTTDLAAGRRIVGAGRQAMTDHASAQVAKMTAGRAEAAAVASVRRLQVESNPPGAHVLIDGHDRGLTPLTLDDLSVGSHKVVLRGIEGSVQRTISMGQTGIVQLNEAIFSGWLHVSSPIEVQISEGRQAMQLDDRNQVLLAPGPHDVRLENRALGLHETRHIDVRPGETTVIVLEPAPSPLSVNAPDGSTVAVDGEVVGPTPLVDYPVTLGTRDLIVTSPSGEVRRQTITVTVQPVHVNVDFSKR